MTLAPAARVTTPLAARFDALWQRLGLAVQRAAGEVRTSLFDLYNETARHYHTLGHIEECLAHLDEVGSLLHQPDAVELALWFHDAIYVPGAADNERRSAELFREAAIAMDHALADRIVGLIMATKHADEHQPGDRGFMVDIDLAGFGAGWEDFMRKGDLVREEYAAHPDAEYFTAQVRFLRRLQTRRHFYWTDYFRERYEAIAQDNVRRLLSLRLAQGYRVA